MLGAGGWIEETLDNKAVTRAYQLVAGTAWLFARPEHDQAFDYLFIDEAGQVGLANVVATGVAARNIVLVGDQMQLAQPIQGTTHVAAACQRSSTCSRAMRPFRRSAGSFCPRRAECIPTYARSFRRRCTSGGCARRRGPRSSGCLPDPALDRDAIASSGLRFVFVHSLGCTQRSRPEAERLDRTYRALLGQRWRNRKGEERPIGVDDILVVSPYNMQVELLKATLPAGARAGTVDKFQGQEAAIVLVSMATSSGDDLPRNIEFLYSRNRLNVAISRARCLAVIFANPRLLEIPCSTIAQMELVNGLCWARRFAVAQAAGVEDPTA